MKHWVRFLLLSVAAAAGLDSQVRGADELPKPVRIVALQGTTAHVQGIDTDGKSLWVTSVDRAARKGYLVRYSLADGRLQQSVEVQDGERYHPGGIAMNGESIWVPVAEYKALSTSVIQRRNSRTLALEAEFAVDDHIGCVALVGGAIVGGNWDSREFYVWTRDGTLVRKVASVTANAYQDMKAFGGALVASGVLAGKRGAIDFLDGETFALKRRVTAGNTDRGDALTREGMTVVGNELWLLPEDGASRLFVFRLPEETNRTVR